MKVKELIEKLKLEDEDAEVILSADEEGNYYSPLEGTLGFGIKLGRRQALQELLGSAE